MKHGASLSYLFVLYIFANPGIAVAQGSVEDDRNALVAFYDSTGGDTWKTNTNWKSDRPLAQWHGVGTDSHGKVIEIRLKFNWLTGEIPAELENLTNIKWLKLHHNQLTGEIPAELGNLANLQGLWLHGNQLTGEIPVELGNLTNLKALRLNNNQLTGEIPAELGNLTNLVELLLNDNQLTGEIPVELENLTNLKFLGIENNQLTGNLPAGLCIETLTLRLFGNSSLIVNCFGVPDEFVNNERKYFEILQDDNPTVHKNVEFILIQGNSYGKLWISDETFHLFNISSESVNELLKYVFYSTPVDPQKGILEYSIDLLGNLRKNYESGNEGERIVDILCHVYNWSFGGLSVGFYNAINLIDQIGANRRIARIIAHEFVHSINSSYARSSQPSAFFSEGLAGWAKDIIFNRKDMPSYVIDNWNFQYRDLPLFPPRPFNYGHANLFVAYIADRVGVENMKHILQVCQPGGVCDADNPDNGDWYHGIDGFDYALSLLDPDLNIMNIILDFHTMNLVNDSSVTLNGVSYGYKPLTYAHPNFKIIPYINVDLVNTDFSQNTITLRPGGTNYFRYKNTSNLHFSIDTDDPKITLLRLFKEKGNTKELVDIDAGLDEYTVAGDYDRVTLIIVHGNPRGDQPDLTLNISATQNYGLATGDEELPTVLSLKQNYPNPFNPETVIEYELPQTVHVRLAVYDMTGRTVAVLVDGNRPQGRYTEQFNAAGLSTGTYVYRLTAGGESQTRIMTLVR